MVGLCRARGGGHGNRRRSVVGTGGGARGVGCIGGRRRCAGQCHDRARRAARPARPAGCQRHCHRAQQRGHPPASEQRGHQGACARRSVRQGGRVAVHARRPRRPGERHQGASPVAEGRSRARRCEAPARTQPGPAAPGLHLARRRRYRADARGNPAGRGGRRPRRGGGCQGGSRLFAHRCAGCRAGRRHQCVRGQLRAAERCGARQHHPARPDLGGLQPAAAQPGRRAGCTAQRHRGSHGATAGFTRSRRGGEGQAAVRRQCRRCFFGQCAREGAVRQQGTEALAGGLPERAHGGAHAERRHRRAPGGGHPGLQGQAGLRA